MPHGLTKAQALAMVAQRALLAPHLNYPGINSERPYLEQYSLFDRTYAAAIDRPVVESPLFAPPVSYFQDFIDTFYSLDLALVSESDPSGVFSETADRAQYLVTVVDAGVDGAEVVGTPWDGATNASAQGGWGVFTTNDEGAGDLVCCQMNGESWLLGASLPLYFECKFAVEDITAAEVFIGLADTGTDLYNAGAGVNNHVGFMLDGDGNLDFSMDSGGTQAKVDTLVDFVDGSIATLETANVVHRAGFYWDGVDRIHIYVDGVLVYTKVDNGTTILVPDDTCLSIGWQIETDGATAETMWLDYVMVCQARE